MFDKRVLMQNSTMKAFFWELFMCGRFKNVIERTSLNDTDLTGLMARKIMVHGYKKYLKAQLSLVGTHDESIEPL